MSPLFSLVGLSDPSGSTPHVPSVWHSGGKRRDWDPWTGGVGHHLPNIGLKREGAMLGDVHSIAQWSGPPRRLTAAGCPDREGHALRAGPEVLPEVMLTLVPGGTSIWTG